jgi:type IV pilus assembly protein PilC
LIRYSYVATRPDGARVKGVKKAKNRTAAELALTRRRLRNIRLTEKRSFLQVEITAPKVKRQEIMHLSRQLAAFVRAGLPIMEAVKTIGGEARNTTLSRVLSDIEDGLSRGERLSDCLDRHRKVFPEFYRGILRSAELTGQLEIVLDQLANYLERDVEASRKIKSAMIYPAMITIMSLFTVVILASVVLPRFEVFFASLDAELPLTTRMLLSTTRFVTEWWWAILGGIGFVVAGTALVLMTRPGRYGRDRIYLAFPVIGETVQFTLVERFCRIMASMAGAGVFLPEALRVATESLRNLVYVRALGEVAEGMLEGQGLAGPLARTGLFPSTASHMIRVGEETGTLVAQLEFTARYYEGELTYRLKKLTALIEPAVVIIMGLIVGFVAIALVQAMYGIFGQVEI